MGSGLYEISEQMLAKYETEVERMISSIRTDSANRKDLTFLLKGLKIDKEWTETDDALRKGFALYYQMYDMVQARMAEQKIDGEIPEQEKRGFLGAYAGFAAASFITHRLNRNLKGEAIEFPAPADFSFDFTQTQNDTFNEILAMYYKLTELHKKKELVKNGQDLVNSGSGFFKFIKDQALKQKTGFNKKLVDLVSSAQFRVMDEFTLSGFETSLEEKAGAKDNDFSPLQPYQVAGNVLAKKEMLRDMDRLTLYDPILKKNPIIDVGGLSFSVIYVGLPGTGKSSLFRVGWTRCTERIAQVNEFWKSKNVPKLVLARMIIDSKVKSKMYGETGERVYAAEKETRKRDRINIGLIDDIDLLMEGDRDSSRGGADKEILNSLMQILSGTDTTISETGNTQWWAATNAPTSMDPALLQRFPSRYEVDGPQEWFDFADIFSDKLAPYIKKGILKIAPGKDYTPYEMRKGQTGYEKKTDSTAAEFAAKMKAIKGEVTLRDVGEFCREIKQKNPRFTGRAADAVALAVKKRINDYDIPAEFFEKPEAFFFKPYEERVAILSALSPQVTGIQIMEEVERYARIEQQFADDKFESDVKKLIANAKVNAEAIRRLEMESKGGKK